MPQGVPAGNSILNKGASDKSIKTVLNTNSPPRSNAADLVMIRIQNGTEKAL